MEHREAPSKAAGFAQRAACPVWTASRTWRAEARAARSTAGGGERDVAKARSGEATNTRGPSVATQTGAEDPNPQHMVIEGTAAE